MRVKIASWNIAGGRKVKSNKRFDYANEDVEYFVDNIKRLDPDIVCLQEAHFKDGESTAQKISRLLSSYNVFDQELSPSHIESGYRLGNSILSKMDFQSKENFIFPYPEFEMYFKDGRKAIRHDKGLQLVKVNNFFVANTQFFPIGIFGHKYYKDGGKALIEKMSILIEEQLKTPLLFVGDFSGDFGDYFNELMSSVLHKFSLTDSIKNKMTRNEDSEGKGKFKTDYILYSQDFNLIKSQVIETETDHYLCFSEFVKK